jgi:hypothetical protein
MGIVVALIAVGLVAALLCVAWRSRSGRQLMADQRRWASTAAPAPAAAASSHAA